LVWQLVSALVIPREFWPEPIRQGGPRNDSHGYGGAYRCIQRWESSEVGVGGATASEKRAVSAPGSGSDAHRVLHVLKNGREALTR